MEKRLVFLGLVFFLSSISIAQNLEDKELLFEDFLIEIQDRNQLEYLDSEWIELWEYYRENPLNLHTCDSIQLSHLNYFSPKQIQVLLVYRRRVKVIQSIYEVAQLYAWDKKSAMYLSLFTSLENVIKPKPQQKYYTIQSKSIFRTRWRSNMDTSLKGIPVSFLIRHEGELNSSLTWNILLEQDANEPFYFPKKSYGFDFYSGHIAYTPKKGILKKIVLGDYRIQFGEGLQLWAGAMFGASVLSNTQRRGEFEIKPYKSTMEAGFLRGVSGKINFKRHDFLFLASSRYLDANPSDDSVSYFTSVYLSGLHRTEKELLSKNAIREDAVGLGWKYQSSKIKVGVLSSFYYWSLAWKAKEEFYSLKKFEGDKLLNTSAFITTVGKLGLYSAEFAYSYPQGYAFSQFWTKDLSSTWRLSLQQHYFNANYFAPHGQIMRSASNGVGEFVTNINIQTEIYKSLYLLSGMRYMQFDYMTYTIPEKHYKWSVFWRLNYYPSTRFESMFLSEFNNLPYSKKVDGIKYLEYRNTWNNSLRIQYQFASNWKLRSAIYVNLQNKEREWNSGIGLQESIQYQSEKLGLSWSLSYQYFSVSEYDLRAYAYEKSVSGMFENSSMFGEGHSLNSYLKYQKVRKWSIEARVKCIPKHSSFDGIRWDVVLQFQYRLYQRNGYNSKRKPS